MFPQIVETIYSPALPNIATGFGIDAGQAALTLSLYFFAFAVGVVFWGRLCDTAGRRPTILAGLLLYGVASLIALFSTSFVVLLSARMLAAFGAAVGSIGTQTVIRDRYEGDRLARVFSVMGVAMAISPALGMLAGALLTGYWGYRGVFAGLAALAVLLLVWSAIKLPETRPTNVKTASLTATAIAMLYDSGIWRTALLIAIFNVCLFSYYQLAPFRFEQLGLSSAAFGYSGLLLAMGVGIGSWLNKNLLQRGWASTRIITFAAGLALFGGLLVAALAHVWV
ncbi:MAG: MFS transporter, partial [Burkholderiaceae bacterium]|nr:MFS transporter [Burkholderiaceae bacterium]